jgi:hypothetical protein
MKGDKLERANMERLASGRRGGKLRDAGEELAHSAETA